ncbi:Ger(x)C family spore germination C-terminal domain-containing protein [Halalkalibacterium halodurans]|nr:hypothetical protein AMD02_019625 [Halalkalibacterium halodurans]
MSNGHDKCYSSNQMTVEEIKRELEDMLKQEVTITMNKAKELGADVFQVRDYLYRFHPERWKKSDNKDQPEIQEIEVTINPLKSINKTQKELH